LTATGNNGTIAVVGTITNGAGGTLVANGASLQLQGSLTVAGEPLILPGQGSANTSYLPETWLPVGPASTNGGHTRHNMAVTSRITSVAVDPAASNVIYVGTAGGGVWKTRDGGLTWQPTFDQIAGGNHLAAERQQFTVTDNEIQMFDVALVTPIDPLLP